MDTVKVTIGIPVYNGAKFIKATLDSIANQSYTAFKVLILDDCSSDNSIEIINQWLLNNDKRFTLIKNSKNLGVSKCANTLLNLADTEYFQLCGHDDIFYKNKIESQLSFLQSSTPDIAMVYSNMNVIDENDNIIKKKYFDWIELIGNPPSGDVLKRLLYSNFINASSVLCKLKYLKQMQSYNEKLVFEDWQMWINIAKKYKIIFHNIDAGAYRIVSTSIMHSPNNTLRFANDCFLMYQELIDDIVTEKKILKKMLTKFAIYNYKLKNINKKKYLRKALSHELTAKSFLYYIISHVK